MARDFLLCGLLLLVCWTGGYTDDSLSPGSCVGEPFADPPEPGLNNMVDPPSVPVLVLVV